MNKYYNLLGFHLDEVKKYFEDRGIDYKIVSIEGKKDKDKLVVPRVVKVSEIDNIVEIVITYFSNSLV